MPLSERMEKNLSLMLPCACAADIGCDHGFVSIELIRRGICDHVIAADVRSGPLGRAREHIRKAGLEDRIETRISDGFEAFAEGEIRSALIAGMGGALMRRILTKGRNIVSGLDYLVLQPQSELEEFRVFLRENHLAEDRSETAFEDRKEYLAIRVLPAEDVENAILTDGSTQRKRIERLEKLLGEEAGAAGLLADRYGADLLLEDRGLSGFLQREEIRLENVISQLRSQRSVREDRVEEFMERRRMNRLAQHVLEVANGV